jgi:predicted transcriptional regulator
MISVDLDPEVERELATVARETGKAESAIMNSALRGFFEDREDYLEGIASLHRKEARVKFEQLERELGLDR